eukprot:161209_1
MDLKKFAVVPNKTKYLVSGYIHQTSTQFPSGVAQSNVWYSVIQISALFYFVPRDQYRTQKASLLEAMQNRPDFSDIADLGYVDDSGMAPSIQPTALRLNRRLTFRQDKDDLIPRHHPARHRNKNINQLPDHNHGIDGNIGLIILIYRLLLFDLI